MAKVNLVADFKHKVMMAFLTNNDIVTTIDMDGMTTPIDLLYTHIFPYQKVLDTVESTGSYITISVNQSNRSQKNDLFATFQLTVWVICHKGVMDYNSFSNRLDHLSGLVRDELDNSNGYGYGDLKLQSDLEGVLDDSHFIRKMVFTTREITKSLCGSITTY
jgi:hypothetical protein